MRKAASHPDKNSDLRITRDVVDFVILDASLNSDHRLGTVWPSVMNDPRFKNLVHAALEQGSRQYAGLEDEAVSHYEGFIEGVSFAAEAVRQAILENNADTEVSQLLIDPPGHIKSE